MTGPVADLPAQRHAGPGRARLRATFYGGLAAGSLLALAAAAGASCGRTRAATGLAASCGSPERSTNQIRPIDTALAKAALYLVAKQQADGAWRSEKYGCFQDGSELTPNVLTALFFLPPGGDAAPAAFAKGVDYLVGLIGPDGELRVGPRGLNFPVFTSAAASWVVVKAEQSPRNLRAQASFLAFLRRRQLVEALGWSPADPAYGGFGFSLGVPRKPGGAPTGGTFLESNLVATVYGIRALASGGVPHTDPVWRQVLTFVERCQNFNEQEKAVDPRFDDGGFFFIPDDPVQNKAGIAGVDRHGRTRFHSYGTMTADGLRALLQAGLAPDHPRVTAARKWIESNIAMDKNPGVFEPDREVLRNATYYYYAWALAHALSRLALTEVTTPAGKLRWPEALAGEIMRRQRADGSWENSFTDAKEDDPLVATAWAASALAICRQVLAQDGRD